MTDSKTKNLNYKIIKGLDFTNKEMAKFINYINVNVIEFKITTAHATAIEKKIAKTHGYIKGNMWAVRYFYALVTDLKTVYESVRILKEGVLVGCTNYHTAIVEQLDEIRASYNELVALHAHDSIVPISVL